MSFYIGGGGSGASRHIAGNGRVETGHDAHENYMTNETVILIHGETHSP